METILNLEAPWPAVKEKLKEINKDLTDEDLHYEVGEENTLLELLSKKLNRTPVEIKTWIESVSSNSGKAG